MTDTTIVAVPPGQNPSIIDWGPIVGGTLVASALSFVLFSFGSAAGVADSVIRDLSRDGEGRVWLSTARGARVFDGQRWQRPPLPDDLLDEGVNTVMQTRDGRLWFATSAHGVVSVKGTDVRRYSVAQGLSHPTVTSVAEGPDGTVWLAGPKGVATIQRGTITTISAAEGLAVDRVMQVIVDTRGVVWMTTHGGGLVRHDGAGFRTIRHSDGLSTDYLISLMEDRDGALWVGTLAGGLNRVAPAVRELLDRRSGLPPFPVTTVYQRRGSGTWWIGTYGGGLVRLRDGQLRVFTQADGLPSNAITSVAGGAGERVWVGTNGGGAFLFDDGRIVDRIGPDLVGDTLRTIERHGDVVWFGGNGLFRYAGGTLQRIGLAEGLRSTEVRVIYALPDRVWVGTYGGGLQSIGRDGRVMSWGEREGLTNPLVTSLHHDEVGTLWIGTAGNGLVRLRDGRYDVLTREQGLPSNWIMALHIDRDGSLWIGTSGEGLARLRDGEIRRIGSADGLWDGLVQVILEDADGHFWMTCNRGFFRVARAELVRERRQSVPERFRRDAGPGERLVLDEGRQLRRDPQAAARHLLRRRLLGMLVHRRVPGRSSRPSRPAAGISAKGAAASSVIRRELSGR